MNSTTAITMYLDMPLQLKGYVVGVLELVQERSELKIGEREYDCLFNDGVKAIAETQEIPIDVVLEILDELDTLYWFDAFDAGAFYELEMRANDND